MPVKKRDLTDFKSTKNTPLFNPCTLYSSIVVIISGFRLNPSCFVILGCYLGLISNCEEKFSTKHSEISHKRSGSKYQRNNSQTAEGSKGKESRKLLKEQISIVFINIEKNEWPTINNKARKFFPSASGDRLLSSQHGWLGRLRVVWWTLLLLQCNILSITIIQSVFFFTTRIFLLFLFVRTDLHIFQLAFHSVLFSHQHMSVHFQRWGNNDYLICLWRCSINHYCHLFVFFSYYVAVGVVHIVAATYYYYPQNYLGLDLVLIFLYLIVDNLRLVFGE